MEVKAFDRVDGSEKV